MSRPIPYSPSPRTQFPAAASPVRRWFGRLVPLAVLAVLGCANGKPEMLGINDETSTTGDETAGDETAGDETGDLVEPGDDPLARLATECEQRFSCGCTSDRFTDVAACEEHYMVEWAGIEAKAEAAELTADFECYMQWMPYEAYGCDSYSEYIEDADPQTCSFCQYAYGDRQVGETCQDFGGGVGDCAQGLLCYPNAQGVAQCIDPCSQAGLGESCNYLACEDGLLCDWTDATCRGPGAEGESCADGVCEGGLVCDWSTNTCTQGAGLGEACQSEPCGLGLFCDDNQVCVTLSGQGESCVTTPCADGLVCRWDDATCDAPGQAGESCIGVDCAPGLFCGWMFQTCAPLGSVGDPCVDLPCLDGLMCDLQTNTCATLPKLGEPCSDLCADGLLCNHHLSPALCVAWPVGGEPCVYESCAAAFVCDLNTQHCVDEPPMLCWL